MNPIFTRRSVRLFSDEEISDQDLDKIIKAAMQAPSAMNQQCWEFLVVKNRDALNELVNYNVGAKMLKDAPLAIIVLGNMNRVVSQSSWQCDLGAVTQNILLEATTLGLGAVWLGTINNSDREKFISKQFNLSDNLIPYSVISIGYPKNDNANYFLDRYDESRITYID